MADIREVFKLRKTGDHQRALTLAREQYVRTPDDEWTRKALAWCLYDQAKQEIETNTDAAGRTLSELITLAADADELLTVKTGELRLKLAGAELARTLTGQAPADLSRKLLCLAAEFRSLPMALAWMIYGLLKTAAAVKPPLLPLVSALTAQFAKLEIAASEPVNAAILRHLTALGADWDEYPRLFFDVFHNRLRPDDYQRFKMDNGNPVVPGAKDLPSLAEKICLALAKNLERRGLTDSLDKIVGFIDLQIVRFPDNIWLPYHKANLLMLADRGPAARDVLLPLLRRIDNNPWLWYALAAAVSGPAAIGCLYQALTLPLPSAGKARIVVDLINRLTAAEEFILARELRDELKNLAGKTSGGLREECDELQTTDWPESGAGSVGDYRAAALGQVAESLPWIEALISRVEADQVYVCIRKEKAAALIELMVRTGQSASGADVRPGLPVAIRLSEDGSRIYGLRDRPGELWDIAPRHIGLVDHVNAEKGVAHIIISRTLDALLFLSRFPDAAGLREGDTVAVRLKRKAKCAMRDVIDVMRTNEPVAADISRQFTGDFDPIHDGDRNDDDHGRDRGPGFVHADGVTIYVPGFLAARHRLNDGDYLSGLAVYNEHRGRESWKAIIIAKGG